MEAPIPTLVSHLRSSHMQSVAIGAHDNVVCLTGVSNEYFEWRFAEEEGQVADAEPKQNRALRGKRLVSISVGKGRCAAVTAAGALLEWGSETRDPDAPDSADEFDPYLPRELRCLWSIADVRCSAEHSVALTREGKVLTWGLAGGMGRLGLGQDRDVWSPALVEALKEHTCVSIAIGPGNTGATTREFGAFAWGAGNSGQLGNNDIHPLLVPTRIAALQHVECVQMAFGNRHLVVIAKDGGVWTSGVRTQQHNNNAARHDQSFFACALHPCTIHPPHRSSLLRWPSGQRFRPAGPGPRRRVQVPPTAARRHARQDPDGQMQLAMGVSERSCSQPSASGRQLVWLCADAQDPLLSARVRLLFLFCCCFRWRLHAATT